MSSTLIHTALALAASLLSSVAAAPAVGKQQSAPSAANQQFLINYNFETYATTTGQVPVDNKPVNDYNLLHFNTILVNQTGSTPLNVPCHTEPACTAFTANSVLLNSILTPGQDPVTLTGPSYITAAYDYSPVSFFDPYAWYFGCVTADLEAVASAPVSCSITATGVNSVGKTIYSQVFNFNAPLLTPTVPMQLGYFDQGWSGLRVQTLYLSVSNNATTAAVFDNFLATVYGPQNAAVLVDF